MEANSVTLVGTRPASLARNLPLLSLYNYCLCLCSLGQDRNALTWSANDPVNYINLQASNSKINNTREGDVPLLSAFGPAINATIRLRQVCRDVITTPSPCREYYEPYNMLKAGWG